jgi:hypothetical protein
MSTDLESLPLEEINAQRSWHNREYNVLTHELHRRAKWKVPLAKVCHPPKEFRMALVYPTDLPTSEVLKLVALLRRPDRLEHRAEALHLAIHIECYAAYVLVGQPTDDGQPLVTRSMADAEPDAAFEAAIDELAAELPSAPEDRAVFGAPGGRFAFIIQLLLKVVPLFL